MQVIKEYTLKGLSCAKCTAQIEDSANGLDGVLGASVNFMTSKLRVEVDDGYSGDIYSEIESAVHKHEPDVLVLEKNTWEETPADCKADKMALPRICAGTGALAAGIAAHRLFANEYISLSVFVLGYILLGGGIVRLALRNILRGKVFDENFLMAIATIGAFIIGEYAEAVAVMLFYRTGEFFQEMAIRKSEKSISELMDIRPDFARLKKDGQLVTVIPDSVRAGDVIVVKPGEKIPLDGVVTDGRSFLDTSAMTGESAPRLASVGDTVLSGVVNQDGALTIEVTKSYGESTAAKIIDLVENAAAKKAPAEKFITRFARYYTPAVVILAAVIAMVPPLVLGGVWADWVRRGLIFLVISCPCALVISIPLGYFGGIGCASRKGILVKGGSYLDSLANLDIVVFDKTGTLTKGVFKVTEILPADGILKDDLLEAAASAEAFSNHPIALSILREYKKTVNKDTLTQYSETPGLGVSANAGGRTILAGSQKFMENMGVAAIPQKNFGTKVYVAIDGSFAGCIVISDEIKQDSREAIAALKNSGVRKAIMLTGDNTQIAQTVAEELKLDEVYAGLLPHQKVDMLETLNARKRSNGKLAFIGDGINDAPVLAMADVGVAMGGIGSDAAIEAADVVLMTDEPSKLIEAVGIARFTKTVVWQNITFALGVKILFLLLGALGTAGMWEAVFADVGVSLLAVLNSMRVLKCGTIDYLSAQREFG